MATVKYSFQSPSRRGHLLARVRRLGIPNWLTYFSPLREGDTYWHDGRGQQGQLSLSFQSPSRRGHLLAQLIIASGFVEFMDFSPLREGDTYWHVSALFVVIGFPLISVPFAKGTPTGTCRVGGSMVHMHQISVPFAKGTPTGTLSPVTGSGVGQFYFSPLREGDTYWHTCGSATSFGPCSYFSPLREGDTYWHSGTAALGTSAISYFSPLREGDTYWHQAAPWERWPCHRFQSPSRRGHLLARSRRWRASGVDPHFSPLREGDTYWHG